MATGSRGEETRRPGDAATWIHGDAETLARRYYDQTTWIYRWAWGHSFHFAPLGERESRRTAIRRYERELAGALELGAHHLCLDLGCGIGGPAHTIHAATAARIVGLNSNLTQLARLHRAHALRAVGGEFGHLPFADAVFDRAYAFEALCHAADLAAAWREIARVLRRGGRVAISEWCLTDAYRDSDGEHRALRKAIERSYGIVLLRPWQAWREAIAGAGLRLEESRDRSETADGERWYRALQARDNSFDSLSRVPAVRAAIATGLRWAERCHLAPAGTAAVVEQLRAGTAALVRAGDLRIFTPMRFVRATKE